MEKKGRIHIYTGDGKGKSTAGIGLCTRAVGSGLRVAFFQFLKTGRSGEIASLEKLGVQVEVAVCQKFIWNMDEAEKAACAAATREVFAHAVEAAGGVDLLVMDEAISAASSGLLPLEELLAFIRQKPPALELVLTGRGDCTALRPYADYFTEMRMIAHPYESEGLAARKGVEF